VPSSWLRLAVVIGVGPARGRDDTSKPSASYDR
jgi:hypothetical protein